MEAIIIILSLLLFAAVGMVVATKLGYFKDADKDGIPNEVEDFVEDTLDDAKEVVKKFTRKKPGRKKQK